MTKEIDLEDFQTKGSRVFTGREQGKKVKIESKINEIENESDVVIVYLPDNLGSINPSFLEEFLFNVVTELKAEGFFKKFVFKNKANGKYNILPDLEEAVDRILQMNRE